MYQHSPVRFLMILSSDAGDAKLSCDLQISRLAQPYYLFRDMPAEVVLASPHGGFPGTGSNFTVRPTERQLPGLAAAIARFQSDRLARDDLSDTLCIDQIDVSDFAAAFCLGSSRNLEISLHRKVQNVLSEFLSQEKPVALIDAADMLSLKDATNGLIIAGHAARSPMLAACALIRTVQELFPTQ